MVQYSGAEIDKILAALSDPKRRRILELLRKKENQPATRLAAHFDMTLTGFLKHLKVLESAGVITQHKVGRTKICRVNGDALSALFDWSQRYQVFWQERLDDLDRYMTKGRKK